MEKDLGLKEAKRNLIIGIVLVVVGVLMVTLGLVLNKIQAKTSFYIYVLEILLYDCFLCTLILKVSWGYR